MVTLTLHSLYKAWQQARAGKKPSHNQLSFESKWLDNLFALQESLQQGSWRPKPAVCFITTRPKCREIHAPDFADRVVHHWLVPQLERLYEPVFIYDSHANRKGHGTHLARAQQQGKLNPATAFSLQWLCHRLLAKHPAKQVYYRDDAQQRLHAQLVSYLGHAQHANKHEAIWRHWLTHYAWLQNLYLSHAAQLKTQHPKQASFKQQKSWFEGVYADIANQLIQRGGIYWHYQPSMGHCPIARIQAHRLSHYLQQLRQQQQAYILVGERTQGITAMQRAVCEVYTPFLHQEKTP